MTNSSPSLSPPCVTPDIITRLDELYRKVDAAEDLEEFTRAQLAFATECFRGWGELRSLSLARSQEGDCVDLSGTNQHAPGSSIYTHRTISHDEAEEIAQRLINSHFHNKDHARISIPANPERDDDLLMYAYIKQQRAML